MTATHHPPAHLLSQELSKVQQIYCKTDVTQSDPGSSCVFVREVRKKCVKNKQFLPPFLLFAITQCNKTNHTKGLFSLWVLIFGYFTWKLLVYGKHYFFFNLAPHYICSHVHNLLTSY